MPSFTNVEARAVNTVEWLSADTTIAVPVYQRHYRWDLSACRQLLEDILDVADRDDGQTHFIGSILATAATTNGVTELTLIDGQQRVTTLMLLIAAFLNGSTGLNEDEEAVHLKMLQHPTRPNETKLRPHQVGADVFADIIFGRALPQDVLDISVFDDNYQFFLDEIQDDDIQARAWRGLNRLEHVAITLKENANPQQIFESLNSTGAPLANYELIHNYVLMGLSHSQQIEIEEAFWAPIEENTGDAIDEFWRDYLILKTGRDTEFTGVHGVYDVFRRVFDTLNFGSLHKDAAEWREYSDVYRILLDPAEADDQEIKAQLGYINIFGRGMYPVIVAVYRDFLNDSIDKSRLIDILERLQSLWLRRMIVGQSRDHLAAQLCRRRLDGFGNPINDILRRTPADERIRHALRYRGVPHAGYVLGRIERIQFPHEATVAEFPPELEIEHIFPQGPGDKWSGDGNRAWGSFSEEERARYREMVHTLGNVALLEQPLNAGASNRSFSDKKAYYQCSAIRSTASLADLDVWDLAAIERRTHEMIDHVLAIWHRPPIEEDEIGVGLESILDVQKKPGYYPGYETEFEYVKFQEEIWEVHNIRELHVRLYEHLWDTSREEILAWEDSHGPWIVEEKTPGKIYYPLGDAHYLYAGWFPQHLLGRMQELLGDMNLADRVFVKYTAEQE